MPVTLLRVGTRGHGGFWQRRIWDIRLRLTMPSASMFSDLGGPTTTHFAPSIPPHVLTKMRLVRRKTVKPSVGGSTPAWSSNTSGAGTNLAM